MEREGRYTWRRKGRVRGGEVESEGRGRGRGDIHGEGT